jgi:Holliday junction resolvasome RuvABC endonuclease subunit
MNLKTIEETMLTPLLAKTLSVVVAAAGLLWLALTEMHHPVRQATPVEHHQVKQAMTGWGSSFAKHK